MCTCAEGKDERDYIILYTVVYNMVPIFPTNREYTTLHAQLHADKNEIPRKESIGDV
jgi:hypothetical protein